MREHLNDIDFDAVAAYERRFRHDVMAHVHAFGDVAPAARGFIHYGATSAFVTDNADLILMRRGMELLRGRILNVLRALADFARRHGTRRAAFRVQTEYLDAYRSLVAFGAQVRWTDLRMTLEGHSERRPDAPGSAGDGDDSESERGLVWSNWEI